jgi:hypothetical protein
MRPQLTGASFLPWRPPINPHITNKGMPRLTPSCPQKWCRPASGEGAAWGLAPPRAAAAGAVDAAPIDLQTDGWAASCIVLHTCCLIGAIDSGI